MPLDIQSHLPPRKSAAQLGYGYDDRNADLIPLLDRIERIDGTDVNAILSEIRHEVYALGLWGGYERIDRDGRKYAEREQREVLGMESPADPECGGDTAEKFRDRMKAWRTYFCLRALAGISPEGRNAVIGDVRARFRTAENPDNALGLFNDRGRLIVPMNSNTPLDVLLDVVALAEDYEANSEKERAKKINKKKLNAARFTALEFLIRRLITVDDANKDRIKAFLKLKHIKAILKDVPGTLGEGRIGGKSAGMLVAYAALESVTEDFDAQFAVQHGISVDELRRFVNPENILEPNGSRFIGSGIFSRLIVQNPEQLAGITIKKGEYAPGQEIDSCEQENEHTETVAEILAARFPDYIERQLRKLFEGIHPKPCIVRSSSELEDRYGAAFAGKYESIYLANGGTIGDDFKKFLHAIRFVYASVPSPDVMSYRAEHGLLGSDEEMGILVQDLNGETYGELFFPWMSGVAMSFATQLTNSRTNPKRGAMAIALGLGETVVGGTSQKLMFGSTIGCDRSIEYARTPQGEVSVVDTGSNTVGRTGVEEFIRKTGGVSDMQLRKAFMRKDPGELVGVSSADGQAPSSGQLVSLGLMDDCVPGDDNLIINFTGFLENARVRFPLIMEYIVQKLKHCLGHDVDVEFTARLDGSEKLKIKVVQCRPQNIPPGLKPSKKPESAKEDRTLFRTGKSISCVRRKNIQYIVYIDVDCIKGDMAKEGKLDVNGILALQNYIALLNNKFGKGNYIIAAPGRFGGIPENGIPMGRFGHFNNAAGFVEIIGEGYKELGPSFGTHFFQDVAEAAMLNMHVTPGGEEEIFAREFLDNAANDMPADVAEKIPPGFARWIKVIDVNKAWKARAGDESDKEWVLHAAQNNIEEGGCEGAIYVARRDEELPEDVEVQSDFEVTA